MKKIFLHISNDYRSINNQIFDTKFDKNWSIFKSIKKKLIKKNIDIKTLDDANEISNLTIFFNIPYPQDLKRWRFIKKNNNNILFISEPTIVNPFNYYPFFHKYFRKIYTWDDDIIKEKKYYKYYWPQSYYCFNNKSISFDNRKLLTIINSNKLPFFIFKLISPIHVKELYSERIKAINFFENKIPKHFDLYGQGWNKLKKHNLKEKLFGYKKYKSYKGEVKNKIITLSKYKFCICFENITNINGYITEKIFDCFKARCIPIYWGANNIQNYIPKDTYVDFRDFNSYQKLLSYITSINKNRFNMYINNIEKFLNSKKGQKWFENNFSLFIWDIIKNNT